MEDYLRKMAITTGGFSKIRILGLGGCGHNIINHMVMKGLEGPTLIAADTDDLHLGQCLAKDLIRLGFVATKGHGTLGNPSLGCKATDESFNDLLKILDGASVIFVVAGLGGGTGTGGFQVLGEALAQIDNPPLVIPAVVLPFSHERKRTLLAELAMEYLQARLNTIICIPNDTLAQACQGDLDSSLDMVDDLICLAIETILDLIVIPGVSDLDVTVLKQFFSAKGRAMVGLGHAIGADQCLEAAMMAVSGPLLDRSFMGQAKGLMINIQADENIRSSEFERIHQTLVSMAPPEAKVFYGLNFDRNLKDTEVVKVAVIANGIDPVPNQDQSLFQKIFELDTNLTKNHYPN
jgi:cell division protein FtsZ